MDALKAQRRSIKAKVTRLQTFLDAARNFTQEIILVRLQDLETAWSDYNRIHKGILGSNADKEIERQELDYEEVETKYYDIKAKLLRLNNGFNLPNGAYVGATVVPPVTAEVNYQG